MSNIKEETINNLLKSSKSEKIFVRSLNVYKINNNNMRENIFIFLICTIISLIIGTSENTVSLVTNIVSILLNVFLALFGIVFTGYAIFQTLLSDRLIINLFEDTIVDINNVEKSKLQETNENFVSLMMLFIFGIIVNLILNIIMPVFPIDYCLFDNIIICNFVASLLINILLYFMGIIIWRMVSFIGNIFHLFNAYSVARLIEALNKEE